MRVEHWETRSSTPQQALTWSNLLGVCGGALESERGLHEYTCDKARGDRPLQLHPAEHEVQHLLRYTAAGEIRSSDARAEHDIEVLRLCSPRLMANRAEVWRGQGARLRRDASERTLRRMLRSAQTPGADGRLPPFAPVIEYYARRKLRQRGVKT